MNTAETNSQRISEVSVKHAGLLRNIFMSIKQFLQLISISVRSSWVFIISWMTGIVALVAITVPSYKSYYPGLEDRKTLVEQMGDNSGTRLLYGNLPKPGTLGQFFVWETGTFVLLLTAIMMVLLAVRLTRVSENSGQLEMVWAAGIRRWMAMVTSMFVLFTVPIVIALGVWITLELQVAQSNELTHIGAFTFSFTVLAIGVMFGLLGVICAQIRRDSSAVRSFALIGVGLCFALRAIADELWHRNQKRLSQAINWLSILGWRNELSPYTDDRLNHLPTILVIILAGTILALILIILREYRGSIIPDISSYSKLRVKVKSVEGWLFYKDLNQFVAWFSAILLASAMVGLSAGGMTEAIKKDRRTAQLLGDLSKNDASPIQQYFKLLGLILTIVILVFALSCVLKWWHEELNGQALNELSVGVSRHRALLGRVSLASCTVAILLGLSGVLMGYTGGQTLKDDVSSKEEVMRAAIISTLGHLPGIMAGIGVAVISIGIAPRFSYVVTWLAAAWSGFDTVFSSLLKFPKWAENLSLLSWSPTEKAGNGAGWINVGKIDIPLTAWIFLVVIFCVALSVGIWAFERRDICTDR